MSEKRSLGHILRLLDSHISVETDGGISGPLILSAQFKILSALRDFEADISPAEREVLVRDAIIEVARGGKGRLSEQSFDAALRKQVSALGQRPVSKFRFIGWAACDSSLLPRQLTWFGTKIRITSKSPERVIPANDRATLSEFLIRWRGSKLTCFEFTVDARSPAHAAHLAEMIFSEFRGAIDLLVSFRHHYFVFDGIPSHPNRLPAFPVFVLFKNDSIEPHVHYWHSDMIRLGTLISKDDLEQIKKYFRWLQKRIAAHFNAQRFLVALRAYCAAIDTSDYEMCLRKYWTVLEMLTGSDTAKMVVRRVASLFKHRDFEAEQLTAFAELRNALTHSPTATSVDRVMVDQLRVRVHRTFQAHLINGGDAGSIDELFHSISLALDPPAFLAAERVIKAACIERKRREA